MWRKVGDVAIVNRSQRIPGYDSMRVAPAVVSGAPCYIIFDAQNPAQIVANFDDDAIADEETIITAAREKLPKYRWERVRGLNGNPWHVCYPTLPFNRPSLFNMRLAPCVTDTGKPGIALYDLEGIILYLAQHDEGLEIRPDKRQCTKQLYSLLMQLYYIDWQYDDEE